jgi:hypothetical protein
MLSKKLKELDHKKKLPMEEEKLQKEKERLNNSKVIMGRDNHKLQWRKH